MDVFSRTFGPAAAASGLPPATIARQLPVFRRCAEPDESVVLIARCRPAGRLAGGFTLLLTHRRLVVVHESRLLRRLRLHLNAHLRHLSNVTWSADPGRPAVEVAATAVDGVRERFTARLPDTDRVGHVDALLASVFHKRRHALAA